MSESQQQQQSSSATSAAPSYMERAQLAAQSVKETISGGLHTVKEIVTGNHDNNPSLQQSDQDFTESADAYASPEQHASGSVGIKDKITQTLQTAKETVKEKLGFNNQGENDVEMNRQDRERMDTDYETSQSGSTGPTATATATATQEQQQSTAPGMREKLHNAKEQVKESLYNAKESMKQTLHMNQDADTEMATEKEVPKTKHQELYDSDPSIGFFDRAYHDKTSVWDLGRPQPSFVLFLASQNLSRDGSVLEVGCGTGEHIIHMASTGHRRCVGIDISDKAIHEAKLRARARGVGERVQFKIYDVRHLQELGSTFDIVMDVCFGHTLPINMRQSYADQLRTVLNPGGQLYTFWYTGKQSYRAHDIYPSDMKDEDMGIEPSNTKKTTTSKSDDTIIVPEGMTVEIVRSVFSEDKGWRVDQIVSSNIELSGGKAWPGMMIALTFVGPKHPASIPAKARDSTGMLQGVSTATGHGALHAKDEKEKEKSQEQQKPSEKSVKQ